MSLVKKYQCPNCNAPVEINPEDAIIICRSCGQAILADGSAFKDHYYLENKVKRDDINEILAKFIKSRGFLRRIKGYKIHSVTPLLLPFWVVGTSAHTRYIGYKRDTESVGSGKNRRTVTIYIPRDERIDEERIDVILGRRGTSIFGYDKAEEYIKQYFSAVKPFNHKSLLDTEENFEYLSSEVSVENALNLAKTMVFDTHRKIAEKDCTKVFDCATTVHFKFAYFVHVPIWEIEYEYKKETYRIAILGNTGDVLIAELPVTTKYRIFHISVITILWSTGAVIIWFVPSKAVIAIAIGVVILSINSLNKIFKPMLVVK